MSIPRMSIDIILNFMCGHCFSLHNNKKNTIKLVLVELSRKQVFTTPLYGVLCFIYYSVVIKKFG